MKICEMFRSIQGEGLMIGSLTYFIRSVGCNLSCVWCDTKYSKEEEGIEMSIPEILNEVKDDRSVCITGGEPLLQDDVYELMDSLLSSGKKIVLETNGSMDLSRVPSSPDLMISMDIKCPSSGMDDRMLISNLKLLKETDQLKFVIGTEEDFDYAMEFLEKNELECNVILCPVGGMDMEPIAEEVIDRQLNVRVLPQLHKIIWGNRRSV